jgi:hypothetical protein
MTFKDPPFEDNETITFFDKLFNGLFKKKKESMVFCGGIRTEQMSTLINRYIASVKGGKRSIIVGTDYVVMTRKMYEELVECKKNT